jgi:hypothetical protein
MEFKSGYLYVVDGDRWVREAIYASTRLRELTNLPIAIIASEPYETLIKFGETTPNVQIKVVCELKGSNFASKVIGMRNSPFENSLFMDTDTFVVYNIDTIFNLLNFFDVAMKQEPNFLTNLFPVCDDYKDILAEYNTGVILFKKNKMVMDLFQDWEDAISSKKFNDDYFDMPQLRNVLVKGHNQIRIYGLHENFNMQGLRSYKVIHGKVAIIHERFGSYWNSFSEYMWDNKKMNVVAKRINSSSRKRIFIPYFNTVLSANRLSIVYLIKIIKIKLRFPKIPKNLAFR